MISREVLTAPRSQWFYLARVCSVGILFVLMWTAWQMLIGWREVNELGTIARFSAEVFRIFSVLQLVLILFFSPLFTAASIAHEKDRRTFVLLLMTDLSDIEIVVGKLVAGLIKIMATLSACFGLLMICALMGGISFAQIVTLFIVTASSGVAGGAMGLVVALWRDRTFQSISLTILMVVFSVAGVEGFAIAFPTVSSMGVPLAEVLNPFRAVFTVLHPASHEASGMIGLSSLLYITVRLFGAMLVVAFGVWKLRVWNPGRNEPREEREGEADAEVVETLIEIDETEVAAPVTVAATAITRNEIDLFPTAAASTASTEHARHHATNGSGGSTTEPVHHDGTTGLHVPRRTHRRIVRKAGAYREPWTNPILWRELMTRAYGTRPLIIKGAYALIFGLGVVMFHVLSEGRENPMGSLLAMIPVGVGILSLLLVNAQGVTSLTSERDSGALDLLLVTELSPKEFIYGKLYGVLYNAKEMVALPVLWAVWLWFRGAISGESALFAIIDFLLLCHYSAMLGLHAAITYTNSRTAIANSLGTIFFLMCGILFCAYLIILTRSDFGRQLLSFMIFIGAGSVALFGSLGAKNPSRAIAIVSLLTPFWSFYCIISLINGEVMAAFLVSVGVYGFGLLAMLVPAVSDFDIALGRTSAIQG